MEPRDRLIETSNQLAEAIARRDTGTIATLLAPGFLHRTLAGGAVDGAAFLRGIQEIPGEILSVTLEHLTVDLRGAQALVTGVQQARVRIDGKEVEDRRGFVDWFLRLPEGWRLQLAVDFPAA
jgi:hypothetical protein